MRSAASLAGISSRVMGSVGPKRLCGTGFLHAVEGIVGVGQIGVGIGIGRGQLEPLRPMFSFPENYSAHKDTRQAK